MALDVAYNALLSAGDLAALALAARQALCGRRSLAPLGLAAFALALALLVHPGIFDRMRLLSSAAFVHAPLVAAALALIWRRRPGPDAWAYGLAAAALAAVGVDAFFIEPTALEVSRLRVESDKVSRPLTIVLIADLQTDDFGDYERRALSLALAEKPDLVLFAGDYLQPPRSELGAQRAALRDYLRSSGFGAPLGAFAVRGNVDHDGWAEAFAGTNVVAFEATRSVDVGEVRVTGLSVEDSFDRSLSLPPSDRFHVVVGHGPDFALGLSEGDLLLAGHTHGGQVRLPLYGPLITFSSVPRAWAAGVTDLSWHRTLVVSRGVGHERGPAPRLRFLCRPELYVLRVEPAPKR
ncbi:MAG TPA: metallophosphoesterase [Polyangiaceae bacterium]|nr:metallophosphoesterase [Polyangiaceae bacterium]